MIIGNLAKTQIVVQNFDTLIYQMVDIYLKSIDYNNCRASVFVNVLCSY